MKFSHNFRYLWTSLKLNSVSFLSCEPKTKSHLTRLRTKTICAMSYSFWSSAVCLWCKQTTLRICCPREGEIELKTKMRWMREKVYWWLQLEIMIILMDHEGKIKWEGGHTFLDPQKLWPLICKKIYSIDFSLINCFRIALHNYYF